MAQGQNVAVFDIADGRRIASFSLDTRIAFCRIAPNAGRVVCSDGVSEVHILQIQNAGAVSRTGVRMPSRERT
ncbi:hypothetical protein [Acidicapsa acidisoli]|uniref:hypothetical protein n=1 Tax=Acidicapsa acidisoli TaxID=1615681 RepID=UPI0021E03FCD|nr:hypothetical protein [Acidicapsa acidisoli]